MRPKKHNRLLLAKLRLVPLYSEADGTAFAYSIYRDVSTR